MFCTIFAWHNLGDIFELVFKLTSTDINLIGVFYWKNTFIYFSRDPFEWVNLFSPLWSMKIKFSFLKATIFFQTFFQRIVVVPSSNRLCPEHDNQRDFLFAKTAREELHNFDRWHLCAHMLSCLEFPWLFLVLKLQTSELSQKKLRFKSTSE